MLSLDMLREESGCIASKGYLPCYSSANVVRRRYRRTDSRPRSSNVARALDRGQALRARNFFPATLQFPSF